MSKLPAISGRECATLLFQVVVPDHKQLDRGTLRAIVRQAGLGVDEFVKLL